jgi:hypothetical protein
MTIQNIPFTKCKQREVVRQIVALFGDPCQASFVQGFMHRYHVNICPFMDVYSAIAWINANKISSPCSVVDAWRGRVIEFNMPESLQEGEQWRIGNHFMQGAQRAKLLVPRSFRP